MNALRPRLEGRGGIIGWWARNHVAGNLLMIAAFVAGLLGYFAMERETFPTAGVNGVNISVSWPGASPAETEEQIVVRIEESMRDLEGVEEVTSTAGEGFASVNIEANRSTDMNRFVDEVKLRVDAINNLPRDAFRPTVRQWQNQNWFMGIAIHGDVDPLLLKRTVQDARDEIAQLPGASRATTFGTLSEEVTIAVSESALRRYGLTIDQVAAAVRAGSLNASAGTVRTATGEVQLTARQLGDNADDFGAIIVRQTEDGATIRVRDVAEVIDGFVDADLEAEFNGEPAGIVALISTENGNNIIRTKEAVDRWIENANDGGLPQGLQATLWWDDSEVFRGNLRILAQSAGLGLLLVLITLFLFLRPTVAFWVTIGIAIAFFGAFAILPYIDVSLNILSFFAFLIVLGIVVDDAIVVGESIHNMSEQGHAEGVDAAILGAQLVAKPVVFAVLTTMMAFAPWMLLSGPEVQFTRQISYVVIAALTFSLIEAFLILPGHLKGLKQAKETNNPLLKFQRVFADGLVTVARRVYRPLARVAIRQRYATVLLFVSMFVITIAAMNMGYMKFRFMPEIESPTLQLSVSVPEGTPFERVQQIRTQVEDGVEAFKARNQADYEDDLFRSLGLIASQRQVQAWVALTPPEDRKVRVSSREMADRLRGEIGEIPDAEEITLGFTINEDGDGIQFTLTGDDLDVMRDAAEDLKAYMRTFPSLFDITDNFQSTSEEGQLRLKPGAQALGVTLNDVTRQVRQAFFGEEVQRLPRGGDDVRVMVRLTQEERRSLDTLTNVRIRTQDGREIPISAVAEVDYAAGLTRIQRREGKRAITVFAEIRGEERGVIIEDLDQNYWPDFEARFPGVERKTTGAVESQQEFTSEILTLSIIMFFFMYILIAVAFGSYFQPILILSALPFAFVGAVIGHVFFAMPLALFSFFGIGAAAGVVVNDNLVLIDYVNRLRQQGLGAFEALLTAGVARFRPILLTSVTTFIGILPLIVDRSVEAQFLKPMVVALGFAVVYAVFLTLIFVPALYAVGVDLSRWARFAFLGRPYQAFGSHYDPHAKYGEPSAAPLSTDPDRA